jgi:hypothetical protein
MNIKLTVSQGQVRKRGQLCYIVLTGHCPNYETKVGMADNIKVGMALPNEEAATKLVESLRDEGRSTIAGAKIAVDGALLDHDDDGYMLVNSVTQMRRLTGAEIDLYAQTEAIAHMLTGIKQAHAENDPSAMLAIISAQAQAMGVGAKFVKPIAMANGAAVGDTVAAVPPTQHTTAAAAKEANAVHTEKPVEQEKPQTQAPLPATNSRPAPEVVRSTATPDNQQPVVVQRRRGAMMPPPDDDNTPPPEPEPEKIEGKVETCTHDAEKEARMQAERAAAIKDGQRLMSNFKPTVPAGAIRTPVEPDPKPMQQPRREEPVEFEITF